MELVIYWVFFIGVSPPVIVCMGLVIFDYLGAGREREIKNIESREQECLKPKLPGNNVGQALKGLTNFK